MPTDESQKRHAQEIAAVRAISQMTGLGRSQIRDALHGEVGQFARDLQARQSAPAVSSTPTLPLMQTTTEGFQPTGGRPSNQADQNPFVNAVVVTNSVCANGTYKIQYTYCLAAPV